MRAASLLGVLVAAKLLVLIGVGASVGGWGLVAYFWQDVVVALVAGAIDAALRRPRGGWLVYAALVFYIAWGVPVAIVLGSPLTWPLLRAARGPLADSISYYMTAENFSRIALICALGIVLPLLLERVGRRAQFQPRRSRWAWLTLTAAAMFALAGPTLAAHVETRGLNRNAITALVPVGLPGIDVVAASASPRDWRASPFPVPSSGDGSSNGGKGEGGAELSSLHGAAKGFNVIVVVLESTAARYLTPYGAAEDPTPNLTALAGHAVLFENAFATYPESTKGLFSTLCSRYPAFGVPAERQAGMACDALAGQLGRAGYGTALFHSGRFGYLGMDAVIAHQGFDLLEDAGAIGGNVHSSFGVDEPATVARMLRWIDAQPAGAPFFATYLPIAGHHPYATPEPGPFTEDSELARYRNALHYGDEALGSLLAGLRARHLDDRTMLVVFGDHGEAFGQHPGNIGHTLFIDDENVRVPYLIAVPGVTTTPMRVSRTTSLIDTAPTILDLLDLPLPGSYEGTSLLQPGSRMALFFTDYSLGLLGLRDGCWKFIFEINSGGSKLFDQCRDPGETDDLSGAHPDMIKAYGDRLKQWAKWATDR